MAIATTREICKMLRPRMHMCAVCMGRILCLKLWINCDNGIFTHLFNSLTAFSHPPPPSLIFSLNILFLVKQLSLMVSEFLLLFTVSRHTCIHSHTLFLSFFLSVNVDSVSSFVRCRIACFVDISSHIIYLLHLFCLCRENS